MGKCTQSMIRTEDGVAKFKADSEASSLHGHLRIAESAFDAVYDSRFRLILKTEVAGGTCNEGHHT